MDIKNACLQADPFPRDVFLQAPDEWCPRNPSRLWKLNAPAYGLNDAPVEFHKTLKRYLTQTEASLKLIGLRYQNSPLDPCLYSIYNQSEEPVGVFSTHIDDLLGCGVPGALERTRHFLEQRFGELKFQETQFVHVGMELSQAADCSVLLTQEEFTRQLSPLATSTDLWNRRQRPLTDGEILARQCKLGELCWLATVSRPDICARLAQIASRVNELKGSDIYRINDLIKTVKIWQPRTVLKYASSPFPLFRPESDRLGRNCTRGEKMHGGAMSLVGWSDAAYGDLTKTGKCRLGYLIGLMSPSLNGPCHVLRRTSKFTRKLVESSLGGEVYMALLREFYTPFAKVSPSMVGLVDCESLFTHLKNRKMFTEKYLVRHFLSIRQFLEDEELDNVFWLPGLENPADSLTKIKSEMGPISALLESGSFHPGLLRPLRGVASKE